MERIDIKVDDFSNQEMIKSQRQVVAIGYFDGMHQGHQRLLDRASQIAQQKQIAVSVITFFFPCHAKINKVNDGGLMSITDKGDFLERRGFDYLYCIHLSEMVRLLSPTDFVAKITRLINIDTIVVGFDYQFGQNGAGNVQLLETLKTTYNFDIAVIDAVNFQNEEKISTSEIKLLIKNGNIAKANDHLGHPYQLTGVVEKGAQRGRQLGFPTANIKDSGKYVVPSNGVYIVEIIVGGQKQQGICNIGHAPTIKAEKHAIIETNIFNFDKDIYGETITVIFLEKIREEIKFSSIDVLKATIAADCQRAKLFLPRINERGD
ncbi:MAG: bifunctional riboflavin kinase/FAD synthetase [Culicoidibacterales bacterium]